MDRPILSQIARDFNAHADANGWRSICDSTLGFDRPELAMVSALWFDLAGGRAMPTRQDATPRVLKPYLPHVVIYDRIAGEYGKPRYRVRLMGSAYRAILGELTGKFLDDALPPAHARMWHVTLDTILAHGAPLRFRGCSETTGKTFLASEFFAAPLADAHGAPTFVLGVGYYGPGRWDDVVSAEHGRFVAA